MAGVAWLYQWWQWFAVVWFCNWSGG